MRARSQSKPKIAHVDKDGHVSELSFYKQATTNTQIVPYLIQSLNNDLDFNKQWMVQMEDLYKQDKTQMIGSNLFVLGNAKVGKHGYVFWRYEQEKQKYGDNVKFITIDCSYHQTPYGFVSQLVQQIRICLQKGTKGKKKQKQLKIQDVDFVTKKIVIDNGINLRQLDNHIKSKPNLKLIIAIKNCQVLVDKKKQLILYNLFQWIKGEVKDQIGFAFITRVIDFYEKLEKRVKSRSAHKIAYLVGVQDVNIIKRAIINRFQFSLKQTDDVGLKTSGRKLIGFFEQSNLVQKLISQENKSRRQMPYYLHALQTALAIQFTDKQKSIIPKDIKQFERIFDQGFSRALEFIYPRLNRQKNLLLEMNYPQFITMAIIRKMLNNQTNKMSLKQILKQQINFKIQQYSTSGNSFIFSEKNFERALKNLKRVKIIDIYNEKDIENGQICCWIDADAIKQIILQRKDLPSYVRNLLD